MKRLLCALLTLCGLPLLAADSTIGNLTPITTVPDAYRMPWENPAVQDYYITFANLTNQILAGYAGQAYAQGLTNGFLGPNATNDLAIGLIAYANGVTNGYPWTNVSFVNATGYVGTYYQPLATTPTTNGAAFLAASQTFTRTNYFEADALGTTITPIVYLTNATSAALGAQQVSPALMFGGQGWRSGNSTTMPVQMGLYNLPVQGSSANPIGGLTVVQSVSNSSPASTGTTLFSDGTLTVGTTETLNWGVLTLKDGGGNGNNSISSTTKDLRIETSGGGGIRLINSNGLVQFNAVGLIPNPTDPALKIESTNAPTLSVRTGIDGNYASLVASNLTASGSVTATNNYVHQLYATNGYTICTASKEIYMVNSATNPLFVLPDASTVTGKRFMFTTTNVGSFFIVTNATGTQTIADGKSFSYTNDNNGQKVTSFISDGAHWWLTSKGRTTFPSASWSCSTNTTFANVTNTITLDTTEANNGVGIALDNSGWFTPGVGSRIYVTNAGMYMLTFSAVWSKVGATAENGDIWIRQNSVDIPRTMTLISIPNTSTNCMTVNFVLPVTGKTYFDLQGASPNGNGQLQAMPAITSPFNRPACPSVIVTVNKISD